MKKLYLVLCMALCMVAFTACGKTKADSSASFDESTLKSNFEAVVNDLAAGTYNEITSEDKYEEYVTNYGGDIAQSLKTYVETSKDIGSLKKIGAEKITYADDTATVESKIEFEKDAVVLRMTFDKKSQVQSFSTEIYKTLGQKMANAGLNTLMGMGTVFIVLIFISIVIALLKYVPKLFEKRQSEVAKQPVAVVTEEAQEEEEDVTSDEELVAVITAAIMASMGDKAVEDGLVVRSIRKVNSKWKNA